MEPAFIERRLELRGKQDVLVRFLRPVRDDENCYRCDYKIIWPDRERTFHGFGIDDVQALMLAMQNAHADLLSSPESKAGLLLWLGERNLGLPMVGQVEHFK
jgi:hypothetical protein